jgi:hypothetical protein
LDIKQSEQQTEQGPKQQGAGRKPKEESRATELRQALIAWQESPKSSRPSLRALAAELGTSHQLLKHYLGGLEKWRDKQHIKHIRAVAKAKNVPVTREFERRYLAWIKDIEERRRRDRPKIAKLAPKIAAAHKMLDSIINRTWQND